MLSAGVFFIKKPRARVARLFVVPFVALSLCNFVAFAAHAANTPIGGPGPAIVGGGGNLTGFYGGVGAINNNQWNQMINPNRTPPAAQLPAADFGNCNAIVTRCAQPKCPGGGCIDMAIAVPIVNGCVAANAVCKQYGDDLVQAISAQMVANATNKAQATQAQMAAAATAAAASAQNDAAAQQMAAMQQQMQQMQEKMAADQAAQQAQMAAAAAAQQAAAATAAAQPAPATGGAPSTAIPENVLSDAAARGVSADIIARNQASGQILSQLENVSVALQNVKKAMQDAFAYAGCDTRGENCTGPKRVAAFKVKAAAFFDPFETVQEEVYNALIQAQALGVDISDIYMMLSSSCNVWGQYLCEQGQILRFSGLARDAGGKCEDTANTRCAPDPALVGKIVPPASGGCQLLRLLGVGDDVYQNWLDVPTSESTGPGSGRYTAVACASDALATSGFFKNLRMNVDDVGTDDLAAVLSADVIMPAKGPPAATGPGSLAVCAITSAELSSILISKRINASTAIESQGAIATPTPTATYAQCMQDCNSDEGVEDRQYCLDRCANNYMKNVYTSSPAYQAAQRETINKMDASVDANLNKFKANMPTTDQLRKSLTPELKTLQPQTGYNSPSACYEANCKGIADGSQALMECRKKCDGI
ncbi:MAG: hypothetical protein FWC61_01225 [Proteobacteria bacterium]|nr:hypothetical protein [Pseudomonadota bacterium]